MNRSLRKISREQAKWIALRHFGFPGLPKPDVEKEEMDWFVSVTEGSTETPVEGAYYVKPLKSCDSCWIVQISSGPSGVSILDGPGCTYVFVDQRTGEVLGDLNGWHGG